jgi:hypothetical protein
MYYILYIFSKFILIKKIEILFYKVLLTIILTIIIITTIIMMSKIVKQMIKPAIQDILLFNNIGHLKSKNDENNKKRENVLAHIFHIDEEYFTDPTYGDYWKTIKKELGNTLKPLCNNDYSSIQIKQMGGMSYNYDFIVYYMNNDAIIKEIKIEFKHNNSNIVKLVQFIELFDKDCFQKYNLCPDISYSEFYYDLYLDTYLKTDEILSTIEKPTKADYLKNIHDIKYKHPFFKLLYERKNNNIKEKKDVANESVKDYLHLCSNTFNFEKLTEKLKESQENKVFLLWDCKHFNVDTVETSNMVLTGIKEMKKNSFIINVNNFKYDIGVRIRWANNNGLANPTWKFSYVSK